MKRFPRVNKEGEVIDQGDLDRCHRCDGARPARKLGEIEGGVVYDCEDRICQSYWAVIEFDGTKRRILDSETLQKHVVTQEVFDEVSQKWKLRAKEAVEILGRAAEAFRKRAKVAREEAAERERIRLDQLDEYEREPKILVCLADRCGYFRHPAPEGHKCCRGCGGILSQVFSRAVYTCLASFACEMLRKAQPPDARRCVSCGGPINPVLPEQIGIEPKHAGAMAVAAHDGKPKRR